MNRDNMEWSFCGLLLHMTDGKNYKAKNIWYLVEQANVSNNKT